MEKEELQQYRSLLAEVRQLRLRLENLEESMYAPRGQHFTSTPRARYGGGKTMDDLVCRHMELEGLYLEKLAERNRQLISIERAINSLDDPAERMVLRYRYIDGYSWDRVCAEMAPLGYAARTVYRLHGYALLKLKEPDRDVV